MSSIQIQNRPRYKLLCLIIASKNAQYPEFEQQWRKYIEKINQSTIQFFFLYCANETTVDTTTHTITIQDEESLIPGIFNKTIHAMMETIQIDYEYLLRTNLSSFFDFQKLLHYLEQASPRSYTGTFLEISNEQIEMTVKGGLQIRIPTIFLNGAAFIMSKDVVFSTISKYTCMTPQELSYIITLPDDVAISLLVASFYDWRNMRILPRFAPLTRITLLDIPPEVFHVRLKTPHIYGGSRQIDIENMSQLINDMIIN
jgi:hypothetical protein